MSRNRRRGAFKAAQFSISHKKRLKEAPTEPAEKGKWKVAEKK